MNTRDLLIHVSIPLLARHGYAGTSMRTIAEAAGVKASVIYHYFSTKDESMREVRSTLNQQLDAAFDDQPADTHAGELLRRRLRLNLEHRESIVALLQYFMAVKQDFPVTPDGYVPPRAYRHMREIIDRGVTEGCYTSSNPDFDAKVLAHLVNGFLLEYYPHSITASEQAALADQLAEFIERSMSAPVGAR